MRERAKKEELFEENIEGISKLGKNQNFEVPENIPKDYDFRYITSIYQNHNPALQKPVFFREY